MGTPLNVYNIDGNIQLFFKVYYNHHTIVTGETTYDYICTQLSMLK